jgi:diguanylate cyclase (GGDEF)-like protein
VDGLQITVSIGLAHHQSEHGPVDLNQLLTRADAALYQAKSSGRDRVQTY